MDCTVIVSSKSPGIGDGLTYDAGQRTMSVGSLVQVPLRNQQAEGIVLEVNERTEGVDDGFKKRLIDDVLSTVPLIRPWQLKVVRWMADYYLCSFRQALQVFLPSPPWRLLLPPLQTGYKLAHAKAEARGERQQAVLDVLRGQEWVERGALMQETGATTSVLKRMLEQGFILLETRQAETEKLKLAKAAHPDLTPKQKEVYQAIIADPRPTLLFGVTGSGKTEIYAQMIADTVEAGKQAILLVPEILLTEHHIHRFRRLLPEDRITILHSRLRPAERRREWRRIHSGDVALVLGSRSALFAPIENLGVIIMDEEHEWTYKNEQTPRYHARETAEEMCRVTGAKLVLGSATPSLESWVRAKEGRYQLARLPERYRGQTLPNVTVIDLATADFGGAYPFTIPLLDAIKARLAKGEQSILFLNRRGVATSILCLACRRRLISSESNIPFTMHRNPAGLPYLLDHATGLMADLPAKCPSCASPQLLPVGAGTQRIEDILKKMIPQARIIRADGDTLRHPEDMRDILDAMRERRADILLGTQTVVKGLDLPEVTLSAVLVADVGLSLPSFRAGERVFQLLTQLTGRSGRARQGEVILQTFRPRASEIMLAAKHETETYLEQEMELRKATNYPPFSKMIRLLVREPHAQATAKDLLAKIQEAIKEKNVRAWVSAAPTLYGGGKEWHLLLRGEQPATLIEGLVLRDVTVDVDPVDCL